MNLRKSFVLGVTASLTALTLSCSDSQSDGSGAGGMTQTGNGGGSTAGASIGGSMGGSLMGGAPGSGGTTSAATGGSAQGGAAQGGASAQPTGGSNTNGGATAAGAANGGGNAGGGTKASGGSATGGSANNGGTAGAVGSGTGGGGATAKRSAGCEKATTQKLDDWVDSMVLTSGANRPYSVRLPSKYDPTRAYPVVVLLHGCGSGTNNVPMEKATGSDAILVRGTGSAASTCWDTSANGKDVAFFDSMVADVKARFCSDESRVFIVGYSSGSWLVNQLTCIRADVVRGGASVSGGESSNGKCGGPVARIFLHDTTDMDNQISGSEKARDRQLTQNMCDKSAAPVAVDPSPCKAYQGCKDGYPVEWCQTSGNGHGRQDSFAPSTFWNFFKGL